MAAEAAGLKGAALMPALHRNRQVWSTFAADCGAAGNGLPAPLRAQIVSLALWIDRLTSQVVTGKEPLAELISLNKTIMEGLAGQSLAA